MLYFTPISKASRGGMWVESGAKYESVASITEGNASIPGLPARLSHHTLLLRLLRAQDLATPTGVQIPDWFLNVHDSPSGTDRFVDATNPEAGGGFRQADRKEKRMKPAHEDPSTGPKQNEAVEIDYFSLVGFDNPERE